MAERKSRKKKTKKVRSTTTTQATNKNNININIGSRVPRPPANVKSIRGLPMLAAGLRATPYSSSSTTVVNNQMPSDLLNSFYTRDMLMRSLIDEVRAMKTEQPQMAPAAQNLASHLASTISNPPSMMEHDAHSNVSIPRSERHDVPPPVSEPDQQMDEPEPTPPPPPPPPPPQMAYQNPLFDAQIPPGINEPMRGRKRLAVPPLDDVLLPPPYNLPIRLQLPLQPPYNQPFLLPPPPYNQPPPPQQLLLPAPPEPNNIPPKDEPGEAGPSGFAGLPEPGSLMGLYERYNAQLNSATNSNVKWEAKKNILALARSVAQMSGSETLKNMLAIEQPRGSYYKKLNAALKASIQIINPQK
jgi:hypothetical protein